MANFLLSTILVICAGSLLVLTDDYNDPVRNKHEVVYSWRQLDFKFPSSLTRIWYLATGRFIPENNLPSGIKVSGSRIFLSVPRWREGVPSTLNYVSSDGSSVSPELIPYPSWEMQKLGNCTALQYIQSMEIDQYNRMWAVDVGRLNVLNAVSDNTCPPKLVLIDLNTDKVVHSYVFPASVVSRTRNTLNDIVVGCTSRIHCWAYITDPSDPRLVVYTLSENKSWHVRHDGSMMPDPKAVNVTILNRTYPANFGIDGIALSPADADFDRVYYRPLAGFILYSVSTSLLQDAWNGMVLRNSDVHVHGRSASQADGMAMTSQGRLFYGALANNSIVHFNTFGKSKSWKLDERLLIQDDLNLEWQDGLGFDNKGFLYMTTNKINRFFVQALNFTDINFRVVRVFVGSKSYLYGNGEFFAPETVYQKGWVPYRNEINYLSD